jgi:hypothetical protein
MEWTQGAREPYQRTEDGTTRACEYYYIYKAENGLWRGGRWAFNREIDFRVEFSSAKVARHFAEMFDRDSLVIEGVEV